MEQVLKKLVKNLNNLFNPDCEYAAGYLDCIKEICKELDISYESISNPKEDKSKLEFTVEVYNCLCSLRTFVINGIEADQDDFGEQGDQHPQDAEPYCCADMQFVSKPATDEVLQKYGITLEDYNIICEELEDKLSFGCCGWCS